MSCAILDHYAMCPLQFTLRQPSVECTQSGLLLIHNEKVKSKNEYDNEMSKNARVKMALVRCTTTNASHNIHS